METSVTPPKASKILAPNDPNRPDWKVFSDVLGLETALTPPSELDEATAGLKSLLWQAMERNPEGLIMRATHPKKFAGKTQRIDEFRKEVGMMDGMHYIASRLINAKEDASKSKVLNADRGSSYDALDYWDPKRSGVLSYIGGRVGFILQSYYTEKAKEPNLQSIEVLASNGVDLDKDGRTVRQMRSDGEDESPTYREGSGGSSRLVEQLAAAKEHGKELRRKINSSWQNMNPSGGFTDEYRELVASMKEVVMVDIENQYRRSPSWRDPLKSAEADTFNRPEFSFFSMIGQAAVDTKRSPIETVRERALQAFDLGSHKMDLEEVDDVRADIEHEWDPSKETFFRRYPEVVNAALQAVIEREAMEVIRDYLPEIAPKGKTSRPMEIQLGLFESEINEVTERGDARDRVEPTASYRESEVWSARATDEDLHVNELRQDYHFFMSELGLAPDHSLVGQRLYDGVKEAARDWLSKTAPHAAQPFLAALEKYDPSKDGFATELILEVMRSKELPVRLAMDVENPQEREEYLRSASNPAQMDILDR